ncbi:hypothetical protein PRMUPPPA20_09570 [Xylanibacter ruminicola]|uniref:Membrane protein n=2 Tax=Xylanibacter ruminicola TaxID=839 RepID=D5EX48_XYLR2|nr:hypothetical protein [Xylanibacter ruminicola]ADE82815.1 putative membrane protein [Xylanibacter ruminicola 23]GJG32848.1 hypothetical protein PRMUPPPA20_09570 [Xylanibacter ruminicola]SEH98639.1 hypothetical protein SAMN02745192_2707 [Xylanibacter ruminicola]
MNIGVVFIYLVTFSLMFYFTPVLYHVNASVLNAFMELSTIGLCIFRTKEIFNNKILLPVFIYMFALFLGAFVLFPKSVSYYFGFASPMLLCLSIKNEDYRYLKPLFVLIVALLISNVLIAYYERFSMTHLFEVNAKVNKMDLLSEIYDDVNDENHYRAMALFGHPLTNSNILMFLSFAVYFSKIMPSILNKIFLFVSLLSIFYAFQSRGAAIISVLLLIIVFWRDLMKQNNILKVLELFIIGLIIFYIFENIEEIAPRFIANGADDESSMYRIWTLNFYLSLPFTDKLLGGVENPFGENGIIMILGEYGMIVGGIFVLSALIIWWKVLKGLPVIEKLVLYVGFVLLASMNNNLYYMMVPAMYMITVLFISRASLYRNLSKK